MWHAAMRRNVRCVFSWTDAPRSLSDRSLEPSPLQTPVSTSHMRSHAKFKTSLNLRPFQQSSREGLLNLGRSRNQALSLDPPSCWPPPPASSEQNDNAVYSKTRSSLSESSRLSELMYGPSHASSLQPMRNLSLTRASYGVDSPYAEWAPSTAQLRTLSRVDTEYAGWPQHALNVPKWTCRCCESHRVLRDPWGLWILCARIGRDARLYIYIYIYIHKYTLHIYIYIYILIYICTYVCMCMCMFMCMCMCMCMYVYIQHNTYYHIT